jgi:hypothetical protein
LIFVLVALAVAWCIVLIVLHELGHAVTAWALGFRVFNVRIGFGNRLCKFKVLGGTIEIFGIPFGGLTVAAPHDRRFLRCRFFLYILAGPATHALLIGLVLTFLADIPRNLKFVVAMSVPPNLYLLACCLFPHRTRSMGLQFDSDGLQLLKSPFRTRHVIREIHGAFFCAGG